MLSRSLVFVLLLVCAVRAQAPTSSASSASSTEAAASILLDTASYSYIGCYNETTKNPSVGNTRALAGGNMTDSDTMTIEQCFAFCGQHEYAALEYGRECWCASTLNAYAAKLDDASCSLTCTGDETQRCGGSLMLTTYQRKANAKSGGHRCYRFGNHPILVVLSVAGLFVTL